MSITAYPGLEFTAIATGLAQGLVGTLTFGVRKLPEGTVVLAPSNTAIAEFPQVDGTSNYRATRTMPPDAASGDYETVWPSDLVEGQEQITIPASGTVMGPFYVDAPTVRRALDPLSDGTQQNADPGTAASMGDDELDVAIRDAQSEIDAKVPGAPYPLADLPRLVVDLTRDVAAYLATLTFRKGEPLTTDDPVRLRYTRARGLLDDLAAGRASLGVEGGAGAADAAVVNPYFGALWSLEQMGIGVDPDWPRRPWPIG